MAGLVLLPGGVLNGLVSPVVGRMFDKWGPRPLIIPGMILLVMAMWMFSQISLSTKVTTFALLYALLMIAVAMIVMPAQTNGLNQLPVAYYPHGTAILNTLQQIASAVGIAFYMSIMVTAQRDYLIQTADHLSQVKQAEAVVYGVRLAFTVGIGFALAGLVVAVFMKRAVLSNK